MKTFYHLSALMLLFAAMILLTGCPVETKYPLEVSGKEKIDFRLIATWSNNKETADVKKVTIRQFDDYTYYVRVDEKGENYFAAETIFIGWLGRVGGKLFLILQPMTEGKAKESAYLLYNIEFIGDNLTTHDVGLIVGGIDAITSTDALKKEVEESLKKPDCLSEETNWVKE